jgi:hypothetical protein
MNRIARVRCWTWGCTVCTKPLKEAWQNHITAKLFEVSGPLYSWEGSEDQRKAIYYRIRRMKGRYFCIDRQDGTNFIVSDVQFLNSAEIGTQEASDRCREMIKNLPLCKKPIHHSRAWKIGVQPRENSEWERAEKLPHIHRDEDVLTILREEGVEPKPFDPKVLGRIAWTVDWRTPEIWTRDRVKELEHRLFLGMVKTKADLPADDSDDCFPDYGAFGDTG